MKKRLSSLERLTYEQYSYEIAKQLFGLPQWKSAQTIAITMSLFPEVDTWQIIRKGWDLGKKIVIPKCIPKQKEMIFRELTSFTQLESVYFGLYEPIESETPLIHRDVIDLVIVPGIAFNEKGYRIGFGGGYYDRFLQNFNKDTISLAFSLQIQDSLIIEPHDIPVQTIVTEERIISCNG